MKISDDELRALLRDAAEPTAAERQAIAAPPGFPRRGVRRPPAVALIASAAAVVIVAVGVGVVVSQLDGGHTGVDRVQTTNSTAPTPTSSTSPTPAATSRSEAYGEGAAEVQRFLDTWARDGLSAAGRAFLVPDEQVPPATRGFPTLIGGRVVSYRPSQWFSSREFTLLVTMSLHFAGDPGAYGEGANTRFVTFTRITVTGDYRLSFATGP